LSSAKRRRVQAAWFAWIDRIPVHVLSLSLFLLDIAAMHFTSLPYGGPPICLPAQPQCRRSPMLDLVLLISVLAFFALTVGYAVACDRL
jgi:hypothetical protein